MLFQHMLSGLATGTIYALLGLAIVMIYQTTRHINLAQGEMVVFATLVAWQLMSWGVPYWPAFVVTVAIAFVIGAAVQLVVMHPLREALPRFQIGAMIALFLIFNSVAGFVWGQDIKAFHTPFGLEPILGSTLISGHRAGMIVVTLVSLLVLYLFLTKSDVGLRLRAAAENRMSARVVGIRVDRLNMLGWGLAAALGAVAGMLIAPVVFLEPQMMFFVFPYAVAAAVLGGLMNPFGAVLGGVALGILETLATVYLPEWGRELKLSIALVVILVVLVVRPQGLFSDRSSDRV